MANAEVPAPMEPGGIPLTSTSPTGSAASSVESEYGDRAIEEVEKMLENTENLIKNLGGVFPPSTNVCSGDGKRKRFFDPLAAVKNLANDVLGMANCVDDILNDITSEIGPLIGPPPPPAIISAITAQLAALEMAGKLQQEDDQDSEDNEDGSSTSDPASARSSSSQSSSGSSSSSAAPSACPMYIYPEDDITQLEGNLDSSIGIEERSIPEESPDGRHTLAKRNSNPLKGINSCDFPCGNQVKEPPYMQMKKLKNLGMQPNANKGVNGQIFGNAIKCIERHSGWKHTEHELQLPKGFLGSKIDTPDFSCDDMNKVFFPISQGKMQNKMQKIFDQLPGMQITNGPGKPKNINPGFACLEQALNSAKGLKDRQTKIDTIQDFIMLFGVIKDSDFQKMYDVTKNRIDQAFSGVDDLIMMNCLKRSNGTPIPATWAEDYKNWMTQYLADIGRPAWTWASTTRDELETEILADKTTLAETKDAQLKQLADIKLHPGFSNTAFVCDFGLTW
ncbi:MAG: hypothetical protein Q9163_000275 [Psora crenata]